MTKKIDAETGIYLTGKAVAGLLFVACVLMLACGGIVSDVSANKKHVLGYPARAEKYNKDNSNQKVFNNSVKKDIESINRELKELNSGQKEIIMILRGLNLITNGEKNEEKNCKKTS